jgi:hypothetical protein
LKKISITLVIIAVFIAFWSVIRQDLKVVEAPVVEMCVEGVSYIRLPDADCEPRKEPHYNWIYIVDHPRFPREIPAVGDAVRPRERFTYQRPTNKGEIVRVPAEGALFAVRMPTK